VYQVYREQLVDGVYEYHAEVVLHTSHFLGTYTSSCKGGTTSTLDKDIQFAVFEAITELSYNEIQMQHHPGFFFYPSLFETGRVRFPTIHPEFDCSASHMSRYMTARYLLIHSLSVELNRTREALATAWSAFTPPTLYYTPTFPPATIPPPTPSQSGSDTLTVTPCVSPAEWSLLLDTPTAPMLHSRPAPDLEEEPFH
jgi:hypothetical protein